MPVWKRHSFPQDLAAEISFMEEAHMFWAVWSIPRQLHKPKFLHFGGGLPEALGQGIGEGGRDGSQRAGVGSRVQNDPVAGKLLIWLRWKKEGGLLKVSNV